MEGRKNKMRINKKFYSYFQKEQDINNEKEIAIKQ